jgi:hypothetical protein
MRMKNSVWILLLAATLLGCGRQQTPRHIVILPDVSGSIDRGAEEDAFKAIEDLVSHLERGDKITVIPILGDAQAEASGRIIRFEVPSNRQAYDSDLRYFAAKVRDSLEELKTLATKYPGTKTDIVGSISLAVQEFQFDPGGTKGLLILLSDFIHETDEINFRTDKRLNTQSDAKEFAGQIMKREGLDLRCVPVYLGLLRSPEYADLSWSHRTAIQAFWINYFKSAKGKPWFATDGLGVLKLRDPRMSPRSLCTFSEEVRR